MTLVILLYLIHIHTRASLASWKLILNVCLCSSSSLYLDLWAPWASAASELLAEINSWDPWILIKVPILDIIQTLQKFQCAKYTHTVLTNCYSFILLNLCYKLAPSFVATFDSGVSREEEACCWKLKALAGEAGMDINLSKYNPNLNPSSNFLNLLSVRPSISPSSHLSFHLPAGQQNNLWTQRALMLQPKSAAIHRS